MFWNCGGIRNKKHELQALLQEEKYDLVALCEVNLPAGLPLSFPGYYTYRTDRVGSRGGGTAVLVRRYLTHYQLPNPNPQFLEITAVELRTRSQENLVFAAIYSSPSSNRPFLTSDLEKLNSLGPRTLVVGDFNSKHTSWNSLLTSPRGKILYDFVEKNKFEVWAPSSPTHYGTRGRPDILDIALSKGINKYYDIDTINELSSDHLPVTLNLYNCLPFPPDTYNKINWLEFQSRLLNTPLDVSHPSSPAEIDTTANFMEKRLDEAIQNSTRKFARKNDEIPVHAKHLIKDRQNLKNIFRLNLCPQVKKRINRLTREIRAELLTHYNNKWEEHLKSLVPQDGSLWNMTKAFKRKNLKINKPLHGPQGLVYTDDDKAEVLADSLELNCSPIDDNLDQDTIDDTEDKVHGFLSSVEISNPLPPFTFDEIQQQISELKTKSAPGLDGISNTALKHLPKKEKVQLLSIFNSALQHGHFPSIWKRARVVFIVKPGKDPLFADNYRPISLLSTLGKLYEKLILLRMKTFIESHQLLPPVQFGFVAGHSTTQQLLRVVNYATQAIDERKYAVMVMLDVKRAFDTVWHPALLSKLIDQNFPPQLIKIIHNYLNNRSFVASSKKKISSPRPLQAGVPQGSVLSPTLFNLFTADLPNAIPSLNGNVLISCYADDVAFVTRSFSEAQAIKYMQTVLDHAEEWYHNNRLAVNSSKSVAIKINRRLSSIASPLTFNDSPIPWQPHAKYLGVIIDKGLRFTEHIKHALDKANKAKFCQFPLLKRSSKLSISNKLLLYRSMILPILLYAAPVWAHASSTYIKKIQIFQNKTLRMISNMPYFIRNVQIHSDLEQKLIKEEIHKISSKFFDTVSNHNNVLLSEITSTSIARQGRIVHPYCFYLGVKNNRGVQGLVDVT